MKTWRESLVSWPEWLLRAVLGLAALVAMKLWFPGVLAGGLRSFRAAALIVGLLVLAIGAEWWLRRRAVSPIVTRTLFYGVIVIALAGAVIPSFMNSTAHDKESATFKDAHSPMPSASASVEPSATAIVPAEPIDLGRSRLVGVDHRASGTVRLVRATNGALAVRFEGIDIEAGPDYQVWIVPGTSKEDTSGGNHLGKLRANKGDLEYTSDARFDTPVTVLVWCRAFAVPVAKASF